MLPPLFWIPQRHCHVCGDLNVHPQSGRKQVKIDRLIDSKNGWIHKVPHMFGTYAPPVGWKIYRNCSLAAVTDFFILHVFNLRFVSSLYIFWTSSTPYGRRTFQTAEPILQKSFDRDLLGLLVVDRDVSSTFDAMLRRWIVRRARWTWKQTSTLQKLTESRKTRNFIFKSALGGEYVGS